MKKIILSLLTVASATLFAIDSDLDGVDDSRDLCPNTSMSELVSPTGCTIQTLGTQHHFDIIYGLNFYQTNYTTLEEADTISQTIQLDYYYNKFSLQLNTSYYNSDSKTYDNSGMNDTFVGAYYMLDSLKNTSIRLGAGLIFPTYDTEFNNNNTDYVASVNISHTIKDINLFGGYSYTIVNDDNVKSGTSSIRYQNVNAISLGAGIYLNDKLYTSLAYSSNDSMYKNVEDIETASFYAFYTIDSNWFTTFNYAYGLSNSASDNALSLRVGYYF
ncbi:MAG: DUF3187 domain-containing protein [Sulfurimonas sp.]|jgi:hypothetical protein|nr:DUF3187 domain-containing protein [Sulfurimonas sp.]MBU1217061.1 DUF3187 domain-containing protein [bacterium]MBU1435380.1 DUF3187 domain-containing protein [bacterium]MBU1502309.1 DUF3187 domain-containing protein [bacterium]MBU3940249.1 DUF3187 domain-containing protein [bacterium]